MITEVMRSLYDHSAWANQRIFSATAELTKSNSWKRWVQATALCGTLSYTQ